MKGGRAHTIPYGDLTAALLETLPQSGLVFPARGADTPFNGFSKAKIALDRQLGDRSPMIAEIHTLLRELNGAARSLRLLVSCWRGWSSTRRARSEAGTGGLRVQGPIT